MVLRKRAKPMPNFRSREHYLVFGPLTFECGYTTKAVKRIQKEGDCVWLRKVDDIQALPFPNLKGNRIKKTSYTTYPQVFYWNCDLKRYQHIGGYTDVIDMYTTGSRNKSKPNKSNVCNACSK